jgi:hypothetical protein
LTEPKTTIIVKESNDRIGEQLPDSSGGSIEQQDEACRARIGPVAALFPILQRAHIERQQSGEFALRKTVPVPDLGNAIRHREGRVAAPNLDIHAGEIAGERGDIRMAVGCRDGPAGFPWIKYTRYAYT